MRGFTLIELLVVLVIIGTLVSLVSFSSGLVSPERQYAREAERSQQLLQLLLDEALLAGVDYGVQVEANRLSLWQWQADEQRWQPVPQFAPLVLAEPLRFSLELQGEPWALASPSEEEQDAPSTAAPLPQLLFLASGEFSPFRLSVAVPKQANRWLIAGDGFNLAALEQLQ
ncbi:type II secretion system minor pseudopilin GspH [Atopomonas sediminilitoris]|uniref:type II secretion system minor pseudopilin GspH n=1 Tax=Atopomonas sediminilitoris TaxID=2919919 RepID=UPI001F4E3832|nr:type II secretion system minor pseudopilin GspH [Atopomonas sediminilitoris]MCJ8168777.1 type II secretion system minor pseudopilin GspH [Atopomonas sediminilitoris]